MCELCKSNNNHNHNNLSKAIPHLMDIEPMQAFYMIRNGDIHDTSGTGVVLDGVLFPDRSCVIRWRTVVASTTFFDSFDAFLQIHCANHAGNGTEIRWYDVEDNGREGEDYSYLEEMSDDVDKGCYGIYDGSIMAKSRLLSIDILDKSLVKGVDGFHKGNNNVGLIEKAWVAPDGEMYPVTIEYHSETALEIVSGDYNDEWLLAGHDESDRETYDDIGDLEMEAEVLLSRLGFVKLDCVNNPEFFDNISCEKHITKDQFEVIYDWIVACQNNKQMGKFIHVNGNEATLREFVDVFGKSNRIDIKKSNNNFGRHDGDAGWLSPDGDVYEVRKEFDGPEHDDVAVDICQEKYGIKPKYPDDYLIERGWVRFYKLLAVFNENQLTNQQFNFLYDLFKDTTNDGARLMEINFEQYLLSDFVDVFGKSNQIDFYKSNVLEKSDEKLWGGWVSPDGQVMTVNNSHYQLAKRILEDRYGEYGRNAEECLEQYGWVKFALYGIWSAGRITYNQVYSLSKLYNENDRINVNGDYMTIMQFVNEFGKSNQIEFEKGLSNYSYRGFVSPDGTFFYVGDYTHAEAALEIVENNYNNEWMDGRDEYRITDEDSDDFGFFIDSDSIGDIESSAEDFLENKGFAKTDVYGDNGYNIVYLESITKAQFETIYDWITMSQDISKLGKVFIVNEEEMTLKDFVNEFGKSNQIDFKKGLYDAAWLSPDGEIIDVEDYNNDGNVMPGIHYEQAKKICRKLYRDEFYENGIKDKDSQIFLDNHGWAKIYPKMIFSYKNLTHFQVESAIDWFEDHSMDFDWTLEVEINGMDERMSFGNFIDKFSKSNQVDFEKSENENDTKLLYHVTNNKYQDWDDLLGWSLLIDRGDVGEDDWHWMDAPIGYGGNEISFTEDREEAMDIAREIGATKLLTVEIPVEMLGKNKEGYYIVDYKLSAEYIVDIERIKNGINVGNKSNSINNINSISDMFSDRAILKAYTELYEDDTLMYLWLADFNSASKTGVCKLCQSFHNKVYDTYSLPQYPAHPRCYCKLRKISQ